MIEAVAGERQPPALDRVGEDHGRPCRLGVGRAEGPLQLRLVVPAQVADERRQVVVRDVPHVPGEVVATRRDGAFQEALAQLRTGPADEDLVVLVLHVVDPLAERRPAGEREPFLEQAPVLRLDGVPAGRREHALDPPDADAGHDPVQALAVEVDDHRDVAELAQALLEDRLPDVALVELRVADQRHEPALRLARDRLAEVEPQVAVGQGREHRRDRAEPDRSRREVDRVRDPWSATGTTGARRTRAAGSASTRRGCPAGTGASGRPARRAA